MASRPDADAQSLANRLAFQIETRVTVAIAVAEEQYIVCHRRRALWVAVGLGIVIGILCAGIDTGKLDNPWTTLVWGLLMGVLAVPFAPFAKDLSKGLVEAAKALQRQR